MKVNMIIVCILTVLLLPYQSGAMFGEDDFDENNELDLLEIFGNHPEIDIKESDIFNKNGIVEENKDISVQDKLQFIPTLPNSTSSSTSKSKVTKRSKVTNNCYGCVLCNKTFNISRDLKNHVKHEDHSNELKKIADNKEKLENLSKKCQKISHCCLTHYCYFTNDWGYKKHLDYDKKVPESESNITNKCYGCVLCNITFDKSGDLKSHIRGEDHANGLKEIKDKNELEKLRERCQDIPHCCLTHYCYFTSYIGYNKHLNHHEKINNKIGGKVRKLVMIKSKN